MLRYCFPVLLLLPACDRARPAVSGPAVVAAVKDDLRQVARDTLRNDPNTAGCQSAIATLNSYITSAADWPPVADAALREFWQKELSLKPDEVSEIAGRELSKLDAHYLEECFLFRDAVRSLDPQGTVPQKATVGLTWVARQMTRLEFDGKGQPVPATMAVKRGYGATPERAGVFLAWLQQAGLPAGLVGHRDGTGALVDWAIGVQDPTDGQVYLFDPRRAKPLPGPNGQGVATLAQVRGGADLVAAWRAGPEPWAVPVDDMKKAGLYLVPPLSGLAPRMRGLEAVLDVRTTARFAVDAAKLLADVRAGLAKTQLPADAAVLWNPPNEARPTRRCRTFLPPDEGGAASPAVLANFQREAVPVQALPAFFQNIPQGLPGEIGERLRWERYGKRFISFWLDADSPRNLILRGRFDDATTRLSARREQCRADADRIDVDKTLGQAAADWVKLVREVAIEALKARESGDPNAVQRLQQREVAMRTQSERAMAYLDGIAGSVEAGELTFQTALCKHEQAERLQAALERDRKPDKAAAAKAAWQSAERWWGEYERAYLRTQPVRKDQLAELQARCKQCLTP